MFCFRWLNKLFMNCKSLFGIILQFHGIYTKNSTQIRTFHERCYLTLGTKSHKLHHLLHFPSNKSTFSPLEIHTKSRINIYRVFLYLISYTSSKSISFNTESTYTQSLGWKVCFAKEIQEFSSNPRKSAQWAEKALKQFSFAAYSLWRMH